ncbi:ABC transporter ATP-binding protein [Marinomonas balearica]|uniref:Iron complex transport system ATP-binding protein n=1 Tax=Marinomonas balearica TaxID=491947 RepID=A0A4R6MDU1_9GAMM|nr:ABC transporter ATP-binding protein [Marinomonas balearica]TDO98900.1 iron complex transport system ATP-binding protein [Marinomonas balearica]
MTILDAQSVTLSYDKHEIAKDLSVSIPKGKFTVIVGPNACGKSTLLRALSRLLPPQKGQILLNGEDIHTLPTKDIAKRLGLLPQTATAPDGIKVTDLVARGRYPHQKWFQPWNQDDQNAVNLALEVTDTTKFASQQVDQLSGGQRQRVWVAMTLAQDTPLLLLDEPTTYLDIAHQIELLDLFKDLNLKNGRTLVAVLHDLNHACRYADNLIAMKSGRIVATGKPSDIVNESLIEEVFGLKSVIINDPISNTPMIVPKGRY